MKPARIFSHQIALKKIILNFESVIKINHNNWGFYESTKHIYLIFSINNGISNASKLSKS